MSSRRAHAGAQETTRGLLSIDEATFPTQRRGPLQPPVRGPFRCREKHAINSLIRGMVSLCKVTAGDYVGTKCLQDLELTIPPNSSQEKIEHTLSGHSVSLTLGILIVRW